MDVLLPSPLAGEGPGVRGSSEAIAASTFSIIQSRLTPGPFSHKGGRGKQPELG